MKKLISILSLIVMCLSIQAQVKPDIINSTGYSAHYSGGYLTSSVGEPIIGTSIGTNITINQGFLQTWKELTKKLAIKIFLEGLYAGDGLMNQAQGLSGPEFPAGIADRVGVELHYNSPPYRIFYEADNIDLHTDGSLYVNYLPPATSGFFYITIKHRNSNETWSALPVDFSGSGIINYDFTTSAGQAYGSNQKLMGDAYTIYSGDATQDGVVDGSDLAVVDNANVSMLLGYNAEDVNGDGVVDGSDMVIIDNNSRSPLVEVMKPH